MNINKLKYKDNNPRKIDKDAVERLKKKIQDYPKFLSLRPIIYDPSTMQVLGGNQRLRALRELGYKEVSDKWVRPANELTEEEKAAFVVIDNVSDGSWDTELLTEHWDAQLLDDWGVNIAAFEDAEDQDFDELPPSDLDGEMNEKPLTAKISFKDLKEFQDFKHKLEDLVMQYSTVSYSFSGGEL